MSRGRTNRRCELKTAVHVVESPIITEASLMTKADGASSTAAVVKSRDRPEMEGIEVGGEIYHEPPYPPKDLVDLMSINVTHSRCVKTKAADAAGIGYKITGPDPSIVPTKKSIKAIREFVKHVHRRLDLNDILSEAVKDHESIGWGFIEVIRNTAGRVSRLEPVPSQSIRIVKKSAGKRAAFVQVSDLGPDVYFVEFPDKFIDGRPNFIHSKDGKSASGLKDSASELIYWPKPHTSVTRWYGLPDIIPASGDVYAVKKIRDRFLKFFDNNCIPRYAITMIGAELTPESRTAIDRFFRDKFGDDQPHKTLIFSSDDPNFKVQFDALEAETLEADYRETRKDLRDFIRLAHGIPPAILGIQGGSSIGAGSGLSQAEIYVNRIVTPLQRGLHKILDNLVEYGLGITDAVIRLEKPDIRDLNLEMRRDTQYISHGVWSINDVLKKMGMPPIPNGDKHYVWSRRTAPQEVGGATRPIKDPDMPYGADSESEGGSGGGAVSDMTRA